MAIPPLRKYKKVRNKSLTWDEDRAGCGGGEERRGEVRTGELHCCHSPDGTQRSVWRLWLGYEQLFHCSQYRPELLLRELQCKHQIISTTSLHHSYSYHKVASHDISHVLLILAPTIKHPRRRLGRITGSPFNFFICLFLLKITSVYIVIDIEIFITPINSW